MASLTVERDTEILIDNELVNLGWKKDPHSKDRNVYLQRVKTDDQRRKLGRQRPDYTLYASGSDDPIAIIEAKKPGQNIHEALNQGLRYAQCIDAPLVFATDGVFTKTLHAVINKPLMLNGEEIDELIHEALALKYLTTNEVSTLDKKVIKSRSELISIFDTVNRILREEGLQQGLERFTEFANILFLKVLSEIEDAKEQRGEQSKIDYAYRWDYFRNLKGQELLSYVSDTVLKWFSLAYHDESIFQPLQIKHPENLRAIISLLDDLQLTDINADVKGDAFEYFIRSYSASNPSDLGEIFTPRHIVKTMVKLLNPEIGEKIYDPYCGTGGMLIVAFKHLMNTMPRNAHNIATLQQSTIYGADLTKTASIAKMNMILAGDGHNNIVREDSLAHPIDNIYKIVLTNMPFAQTTRYGDKYAIPSRNGDIICPQHCFRAVKPGGRMAVIVPEGFLSNTNPKAYQDVRQYLLENANLKSIISLPRGAFEPYNRAKANILYFTDVKQSKTKGHYWYFDVRNDGYTLDKKRKRIEGGNDLELVLSESNLENQAEEYLASIGVVRIDVDRVVRNNYALNAAHYREPAGLKPKYTTISFGELFEPSGVDRIGDAKDAPVMSITMRLGLIDQSEKFQKRIASADISNYKKVFRNELVVGFPIDEGVLGFQLKYPYAAVSPAYTIWKLKRHDIDLRFLEMLLRSPQMRSVYRVKFQGVVDRRRSIEPDVFLGIRFPIPPVEVREEIVKRRDAIDEAIRDIRLLEQDIENGISSLWEGGGEITDSNIPMRCPVGSLATSGLKKRFRKLSKNWKADTCLLSNITTKSMHPAYQQIIGMGEAAIPLILEELYNGDCADWFWALTAISSENPITSEQAGDIKKMSEAWIEWGKLKGYLKD
jgi:type I restriction enzyme M protein